VRAIADGVARRRRRSRDRDRTAGAHQPSPEYSEDTDEAIGRVRTRIAGGQDPRNRDGRRAIANVYPRLGHHQGG